jgi:hypothetical protein
MNLIIQALIENTTNIETPPNLPLSREEQKENEPEKETQTNGNDSTLIIHSDTSISIDESKVRQNWISWYNSYRQSL